MFTRWRRSKRIEAPPARYEVAAHLMTDVGCRREINEDSSRYIHPGDAKQLAGKGVLALVADGMGGHSAGEVASRIAVDVISRLYYESEQDPPAALKAAFQAANRAIHEAALQDSQLKGMGTTGTALVLRNGLGFFAHVGDSRLYLVRGGAIYQMSEDHSLVTEMVKRGLIRAEEARHHTDKNVLLRALGVYPQVDVTTWEHPFPVREGDRFVLCSDGLYDLATDDEIRQAALSMDTYAACEHLIALAKSRGGHDNITVGILSLQPPGQPAPQDARATREVTSAE